MIGKQRELKGKLPNEALLTALLQCYKQGKENNSRSTSGAVESSLFELVQLFGQTHSFITSIHFFTSISYEVNRNKTEIRCWFERKRHTSFNSMKDFSLFYFKII
jgi:hypothetical protein